MKSTCLLLDFDGTICHLFERHDLNPTAKRVADILAERSIQFSTTQSAYSVYSDVTLRAIRSLEDASQILASVELAISEAEVAAARTATALPGIEEVLRYSEINLCLIAIVPNNSPDAVETFSARHAGLLRSIPVVGRNPERPEDMKPSSLPVKKALATLGVDATNAVLIGDTPTDMRAAGSAGCAFAGIGSTLRKQRRLGTLVPRPIIFRDLGELARAYTRDELR